MLVRKIERRDHLRYLLMLLVCWEEEQLEDFHLKNPHPHLLFAALCVHRNYAWISLQMQYWLQD